MTNPISTTGASTTRAVATTTATTGKISSVVLATDASEAMASIGGVAVPMGRITEVSASAR